MTSLRSETCALFLAVSLMTVGHLSAAEDTPRPNIVLMMSDDQGWGETGYHGHPHLKTPVLDEMAATGLRLDRFYAASPVCTPTRVSCLTGRHANRSGALRVNWSVRPEEVTIVQLLRDAGYRTAHYGKWHVGAVKKDSPTCPRALGFDENLSHDNYFEMDPDLSRNGEAPQVFHGESSEILVQEALRFARKTRGEDKPFFIVVWFGSPHSPYSGLEKDVAPYKELGGNISKRFAEITAMDRAIGTFRKGLDELGARHNTILWFKSDNGITIQEIPESERQHLYNGNLNGHKSQLYEGGLLVPSVIEWPAAIVAGRSSSVPCVTSDILPTLIDIVGIEYPYPERPLDGISLKKLIVEDAMKKRPAPIGFWGYNWKTEQNNEPWFPDQNGLAITTLTYEMEQTLARSPGRKWYFSNYQHPVAKTVFDGRAAWTGNRYKLYVDNSRGKAQMELYDLENDREESTDIASENPELVQQMFQQLTEWQKSVEDSLTGADYPNAKSRGRQEAGSTERTKEDATTTADAPAAKATASSESGSMASKMLERMDQDRDGKITRKEYIQFFAPGFGRSDANRDGTLDADEFPRKRLFEMADVNHDGKLTRDEYDESRGRIFDQRHDPDGDGVLFREEL